MSQFTTYDAVGIKEDVSDVITNISPTKTPFQTSIGTETVHNKFFQWQEDSLRAVRNNAVVEGADAVVKARAPTTMRDNYTQIFEDTFQVSGTEDAVDQYGRAKETAYQMAKVGEELKRDREHTFVGLNQAKAAGDKTTNPRLTASAYQMINSAVTVTAGTTGNPAALTEALVMEVAQKVYDEGAEPSVLMIKPSDSLKVAAFASAAGRSRDFGQSKTITNVVDVLVTPFGTFKVSLNRFIKDDEALLYDPAMWKVVTLKGRNWTRTPLAKTGDSQKHQVLGEFGLKHVNFKASGRIENLL